MTITFNPGPSQLSQKTLLHLQELSANGFLSLSHRSKAFTKVCEQAIKNLQKNMNLPKEYSIFFQPSATVAMDTLLKNLVSQQSFHFVHGAFSQRFFVTAQEIGIQALHHENPWNATIDWQSIQIPSQTELIAITHNETSTGLMWPQEEIQKLRETHPSSLIAIDVTSSFGSMHMNWYNADIWFASVQKCLGLPSGLGILIVSPQALEKAEELSKGKNHIASWQRFSSLEKKIKNYQTLETPNMLAIALLAQQMSSWDLNKIEAQTSHKSQLIYERLDLWTPYISHEKWRSTTVCNLSVKESDNYHFICKEANITLGKGYGKLKDSCIRIANFPAISEKMLSHLFQVLASKSIKS